MSGNHADEETPTTPHPSIVVELRDVGPPLPLTSLPARVIYVVVVKRNSDVNGDQQPEPQAMDEVGEGMQLPEQEIGDEMVLVPEAHASEALQLPPPEPVSETPASIAVDEVGVGTQAPAEIKFVDEIISEVPAEVVAAVDVLVLEPQKSEAEAGTDVVFVLKPNVPESEAMDNGLGLETQVCLELPDAVSPIPNGVDSDSRANCNLACENKRKHENQVLEELKFISDEDAGYMNAGLSYKRKKIEMMCNQLEDEIYRKKEKLRREKERKIGKTNTDTSGDTAGASHNDTLESDECSRSGPVDEPKPEKEKVCEKSSSSSNPDPPVTSSTKAQPHLQCLSSKELSESPGHSAQTSSCVAKRRCEEYPLEMGFLPPLYRKPVEKSKGLEIYDSNRNVLSLSGNKPPSLPEPVERPFGISEMLVDGQLDLPLMKMTMQEGERRYQHAVQKLEAQHLKNLEEDRRQREIEFKRIVLTTEREKINTRTLRLRSGTMKRSSILQRCIKCRKYRVYGTPREAVMQSYTCKKCLMISRKCTTGKTSSVARSCVRFR